jgi:signal transduction histidine kinase
VKGSNRSIVSRLALALGAGVLAAVNPAKGQILTKAIEVRSLTLGEAQQGLKANLHGTVVFVEAGASVFMQDETSTTFFRPDRMGVLRMGDEIKVEGKTRAGLYLPGLGVSKFRVLRHGVVPAGIPANYEDLVSARYHYQRVVVDGVVRSAGPADEEHSLLRLAVGSRTIEVRIDAPLERDRVLVDSRVRIQGLAAGFHNERRQLVQAHIRVSDWTDVEVVDVAPPTAEVPGVSADKLLAFQLAGRSDRRVRIAGIVAAAFADGHVFLQQGAIGFGARLEAARLNIGDRIEIAGFPEMERFSASLVDTELLSRSPGPPPEPADVGPPERLLGSHDGRLVTVTATLADSFKSGVGNVLLLRRAKGTIQARLPESVTPPPSGSRVRLTGICLVETVQPGARFTSKPGEVSLLVRRPGDIVVVDLAPWWTMQRLAIVLATLGATTLLAGLWIAVLRAQVRKQTTALSSRIESEAALQERQRIAREFHDTLEQELVGVSIRLDALATREFDENGLNLISTSRHLVSRIQSETRNLISDLRDSNEMAGDLAAALTAVSARHAAENGVDVRITGASGILPLPAATVHDLRMIARESITNALKHGRAKHVGIEIESLDGNVIMRITDDGCGFTPKSEDAEMQNQFGCAGIRERARKIGAEVRWRSAPEKGTIVEVVLPIDNHRSESTIAANSLERLPQSVAAIENTSI